MKIKKVFDEVILDRRSIFYVQTSSAAPQRNRLGCAETTKLADFSFPEFRY